MPQSGYVALGSNTTVKSGSGYVYGVTVGGIAGATVVLLDSISIGQSPDFSAIARSVPSNVAVIGPMGAAPAHFPLYGVHFYTGLTVAATSNASAVVSFD